MNALRNDAKLLRALREHEPPPQTVTTEAGARATVSGEAISVHADDGRLVATYDATTDRLLIEGAASLELSAPESISITTKRLSIAVGQWNLQAERMIEHAKDAYLTVDRMLETRAKRARTVVERLLELSARRTSVVSEEDTRIDGKRVLLG